MGGSTLLTVAGLRVEDSHRRPIVDNFSLDLNEGETVALVGPSGAGKSSVALACLGLLPSGLTVAAGRINLLDRDVTRFDESSWRTLRGKVGIVFQDANASLNPLLACGRQIDFALRLHTDLSANARRQKILQAFMACRLAADLTEGERCYSALPRQLSGGQRQRVLFTLVTILKPRVLIADEPTASLDPDTARVLVQLLSDYVRGERAGLIVITHQPEPFAGLIDRTERVRARAQDEVIPARDHGSFAGLLQAHQPILEVRELSKSFPGHKAPVLDKVSLSLVPGEILALTGPSGVGKSTLGRCIAGLLPWNAGEILFDGQPLPPRKSSVPFPVQMIYQSPYASLSPSRSVGDTLREAVEAADGAKAATTERVRSLLAEVRLPEHYAGRLPGALSGGERQRVAVARCLAARPRVIVADEPTASLDPEAGDTVLRLMHDLSRQHKVACLLITHSTTSAQRFADSSIRLEALR